MRVKEVNYLSGHLFQRAASLLRVPAVACLTIAALTLASLSHAAPSLAQSNLLQGDTSSSVIQGNTSSSMVQGNVEHSTEPINILFLVDASYSMKEKFGGGDRKMNAAKQVLEQALTRIPADVNLGLRVFGQSFSGAPEIDCRQTTLLVPIGAHNRNSLIQAIRTIQPSGLTPLELALRCSAEQDFAQTQGAKLIILISDGLDTCGGDPCRFIRMLPQYGIKIKCDVVGLQLRNDKKAQEQLNCVAESSGGKYFDANTAGDLIESVARSVDKAISGKVIMKPRPSAPSAQVAPDSPERAAAPGSPVMPNSQASPNSPSKP